MKIAGIIAEYNPFHNGHAYHIKRTRENASHVVAVISGHFTQRGDVACLSKWTRTEAALLNGVDLVIELPAVYACSSAERFAFGGVSILNSLGCIDFLSFGSEIGVVQPLEYCAKKSLKINQSAKMHTFLKQGMSYPRARQIALGDAGKVLDHPNNTLGVEYIKAAYKLKSGMGFFTVGRKGVSHDEDKTAGEIASASFLRSEEDWTGFVPINTLNIYKSKLPDENAVFSRLEQTIMYLLRVTEKQSWLQLPDVTEGLENRLYQAARSAASVHEFLDTVKTKRYTMSRLRRTICTLLLNINKQDYDKAPSYARVLGANNRGFEILAKAKSRSSITVSSDFALISKLNPQSKIDKRSTDIFYLATPKILDSGQDYYHKPIIIK